MTSLIWFDLQFKGQRQTALDLSALSLVTTLLDIVGLYLRLWLSMVYIRAVT